MQFWNEMEGKTVGGRFVLGSLLRTAGRSAWFNTRDDQQRPRVLVVTESLNDEAQLLQNLEAASRIRHPNVVAIETTGQASIDDKPVVYAVLEPTEENLGEVLRDRALTPDETKQITESLVAGLSAIHAAGLSHGHVSAANVLASGDTVKLRSDCLQIVPSEARAESFGQDTGDLGATVFESLTQRKLTSPQDPAISKLPAPFRLVVENAINGTWGLPEIAAALKPGAPLPPAAVPAAKAEPKAQPPAAPVKPALQKPVVPPTVKATPIIPAVAPPVTAKPAPSALAADAQEKLTEPKKSGGSPVRLLAIIALIAALGLIWYFYRTTSRASESATPASLAPATATSQPAANPTPSVAPPAATAAPAAKPSSVHRPSAVTPPSAASTAPSAAAVTPAAPGQQVWRVVVYAYGRQVEAQQKADAIKTAHSDLNPEVFSPNGHGPWLVTLGGPMSRADAIHMSNQVKSKGMPSDSYAQNFSH